MQEERITLKNKLLSDAYDILKNKEDCFQLVLDLWT